MLLVLDVFTLTEALTSDPDEARQTIIEVCDQIAITRRIRKEYEKRAFSHLIPALEKLKEMRPPKLVKANTGPMIEISGLRSRHHAIVEDAVRIQANYLLTQWQPWLCLDKQLRAEHNLHIVTPERYVKERTT